MPALSEALIDWARQLKALSNALLAADIPPESMCFVPVQALGALGALEFFVFCVWAGVACDCCRNLGNCAWVAKATCARMKPFTAFGQRFRHLERILRFQFRRRIQKNPEQKHCDGEL